MRRTLALLTMLVGRSVCAHDLWLEREAGGITLYQGHKYSAHGAGAEANTVACRHD